jgi:hypothetical protein
MDRRRFLTAGSGATVLASLPRDLLADPGTPPVTTTWDSGQLQHLLPTVSDSSILIKASFMQPLSDAPVLRAGNRTTRGVLNDTQGQFWQFRVGDLQPGRRYTLSLRGHGGKPFCEQWELSTFPDPDSHPEGSKYLGATAEAKQLAGTFSRSEVVFGQRRGD